jgi:hypothetical protein
VHVTPSGSGSSSATKPSGAPIAQTRLNGSMPSFLCNVVPE